MAELQAARIKATREGGNDQAEFVRVGARADVDLYLPRRIGAGREDCQERQPNRCARFRRKIIPAAEDRRWEYAVQRHDVILFLHGATGPSTCDFDLPYE